MGLRKVGQSTNNKKSQVKHSKTVNIRHKTSSSGTSLSIHTANICFAIQTPRRCGSGSLKALDDFVTAALQFGERPKATSTASAGGSERRSPWALVAFGSL
ncbi:hypothetical protein PIB30_012408 [Stylosanthes scabra]|uniref:Uncharacterized protein n=1 Tax=Stylosanthes scabra TaxID=79078 RepID=A0ABU6R6C5_9FABA|nr:hypothetical protein [Stylosanthes scabra]